MGSVTNDVQPDITYESTEDYEVLATDSSDQVHHVVEEGVALPRVSSSTEEQSPPQHKKPYFGSNFFKKNRPQDGSGSSNIEMRRSHSAIRASRPSVKECLQNTPEEELYDLTLDVYNMFFLSDICSQAFIYSFATLFVKMSLYILIMFDLGYNKEFPFDKALEVSNLVIIAQVFLIPVAIVTQEELITSFFIFSKLKYSPEIKQRHPGARKWKYVVAHTARLFDGLMFLFINIAVMLLQQNDVLGLFLNFAALMFLQEIDNIALKKVCLDGYWTRSLQESAQDVVDMKFTIRHHYNHSCLQTGFIVVVWTLLMFIWANVHFNQGRYCPLSTLC